MTRDTTETILCWCVVTAPPDLMLAALDAIEDADARNLVWSLVDESWSRDDLLDVIRLACPGQDPMELFRVLSDECLIGEIPFSSPPRYRSRMAETVRLLVHLRQQFPRRSWRSAPPLVADYRFRHEARRFPRRDIEPEAASERFAGLPNVGASQVQQIRRIIGNRRLSSFQVEATMRVIEAASARADRGVVVGAGTGSGKTLAFYLPALSLIADRMDGQDATRVIAIYPRNELLKDQLATALEETRRLREAGGPQIRIGAYFGPTPSSPNWIDERSGWRPVRDGVICPYLTCRTTAPTGSVCGAELVWRNNDKRSGVERLSCLQCGSVTDDTEFTLTRNAMQQRPPDLLFTTTEMLNRSLSDGWSMHVFGVGPRAKRPPEVILLDEAHTYSGVSGAQVAYLLRRWRQAIGRPVAMVGLSATLANAETFFSELTGIPEDFVTEVKPHAEDLIEQGRSYQIVLRGDPASQAALLSTSIQTIMLLRRMLSPTVTASTSGVFGSKLFAFCDNLDLVNRLYRQLLDAEGMTPFNRPDPNGFVLAGLRLAEQAAQLGEKVNWPPRDLDGQYWWFAERIGCGTVPLSIGRTSSQDSGVLKGADVIVATASLEVGFDDPTVGAVLQHKAPRDPAQFLQRVGRAGRTQTQRPWTAVVLSDFGRDRIAYLDYERILDPLVPPRSLPMGNQSVRKMQAVFCFMEWAASRLDVAGQQRANLRKYFAEPMRDQLATDLAQLAGAVLNMGREFDMFRSYLRRALRLSPEDTDSLLWDQPRPLMLEALPTIQRRIATRWGTEPQTEIPSDRIVKDHPLPDFIPRALYDDLLLPEVRIEAPAGYNDAANTSMPVVQALQELAPGRVSLRWAVQNILGLWTPVSFTEKGTVEVSNNFVTDHEVIGRVSAGDADETIPLIRPVAMSPMKADVSISANSTATLQWELDVERVGSPIELAMPGTGGLSALLPASRAYLHVGSGPMRIRRYSRGVETNLMKQRQRIRGSHRFELKGEPVAVGFEALVDAVSFDVVVPEIASSLLDSDQCRLRQLRRDLFRDRCAAEWSSIGIDDFLGDRIVEVLVAAVSMATLAGEKVESVVGRDLTWWRQQVEDVVDGVLLLDEEASEEAPLKASLLEIFGSAPLLGVIDRALPALFLAPDDSWQPWLQSRFLNTVGAALQQAAQNLCHDFDFDNEVIVDLRRCSGGAEVLLSDVTIGGGGPIESLVRRISEDPRRFERLLLSALEPTDLEEVDRSLLLTLHLLEHDSVVSATASAFRSGARSERLEHWRRLLGALGERGVDSGHATTSALTARVFRPGSSTQSDRLLCASIDELERTEQGAGYAFGQQLGALVVSRNPAITQHLEHLFARDSDGDMWCQLVLRGLLWPRAEERRSVSLQISNRFVRGPQPTERTLVLDVLKLEADLDSVELSDSSWREQMTRILKSTGRVRLVSRLDDAALRTALVDMTVDPLDLGWMFAHPRIERLRKNQGCTEVLMVLDEAAQ